MAQRVNITGSNWPTSGTATAITTGMSAVGAGITHVGDYLQIASTTTLQFQADGGFPAETETWHRFQFLAHVTGTPTGADILQASVYDGGSKLRSAMGWSIGNGAMGRSGVSAWCVDYISSHADKNLSCITGNTSPAMISPEVWHDIVVHFRRAADGCAEIYCDGILLARVEMDSSSVSAAAFNTMTLTLLGTANLELRVKAPIETWSGTDISGLTPTDDGVYPKFWQVGVQSSATGNNGLWMTATGTATIATSYYPISYTAAFIAPRRFRYVVSGAAATAATISTTKSIGTPAYNPDGWWTVQQMAMYVPAGSASIQLRNAGDTDDVLKLDITPGGSIAQGGVNLLTWTAAKRYTVIIQLNSSGEARLTLHNLTDAAFTDRPTYSCKMANWTPQAIGKLIVTATQGASGSIEVDGWSFGPWLQVPHIDSFTTQTTANGNTPKITYNVHTTVRAGDNCSLVPCASNSFTGPWGTQRWAFWPPMSRAGQGGYGMYGYLLPEERWLVGCQWFATNAAAGVSSINDSKGQTNPDDTIRHMTEIARTWLESKLKKGDRIWLTTGVPNTLAIGSGSDFTAQDIQMEEDWYDIIRGFASEYQTDTDQIAFSEVDNNVADSAACYTAPDYTHPNATGAQTMVSAILDNWTIPAQTYGSVAISQAAQLATDQTTAAGELLAQKTQIRGTVTVNGQAQAGTIIHNIGADGE